APARETWQLHAFIWDGSRYSSTVTPVEWKPFLRNKALEDGGFSCTPSFKARLIDPGVAFTHGGKQQVFLHDLFVYPDLHQRNIQQKVETSKPSATVVR